MTIRRWVQKTTSRVDWRLFSLDILLFMFFSVPIVLLYIFVPLTFQVSWKGRVSYLMFLWLVLLEVFLSRHRLPKFDIIGKFRQVDVRFISGLIVLLAPTAFTLWQFLSGGGDMVILLGRLVGAPFPELDWPLAFESMLFAVCFVLSVWLLQSLIGLRRFKVSLFFMGAVAAFFMVDTFYHWGTVWFLQMLVPPIVFVAAFFLNVLGYRATTSAYADGYLLVVGKDGGHHMSLLVYWPCAGVHSLIIYTIVVLLLFKNMRASPRRKIAYFVVGAFGTFMVNILRIVSIGSIGANFGPEASTLFHEYYGELFFVVWIVVYLVAVFLWESHRKTK